MLYAYVHQILKNAMKLYGPKYANCLLFQQTSLTSWETVFLKEKMNYNVFFKKSFWGKEQAKMSHLTGNRIFLNFNSISISIFDVR